MWEAPVWEWQRLMINGCNMAMMPQVSVEQYWLCCPSLTAALKSLQTRIAPQGHLPFSCWKGSLGNTLVASYGDTLKWSLVHSFTACPCPLPLGLGTSVPGNEHGDITLPVETLPARWLRKQPIWLCQQTRLLIHPPRSWWSDTVLELKEQNTSQQMNLSVLFSPSGILCLKSLWAEAGGNRVNELEVHSYPCAIQFNLWSWLEAMLSLKNNYSLSKFLVSSFKKCCCLSLSSALVLNRWKLFYETKGILDESWTVQCLSRVMLWDPLQGCCLLPYRLVCFGISCLPHPLHYHMAASATP